MKTLGKSAEKNVSNISRSALDEIAITDGVTSDYVNGSLPVSTEVASEGYDAEGAMKFIVATILVYSLVGVFSIVLTRTRICRRKRRQHVDDGLRNYLRNAKRFRTEAHHQKLKARCASMQKKVEIYEENERKTIETGAKSFPFYLYEGLKEFKKTEEPPAADLEELDLFNEEPPEDPIKKYSGKQRRKSSFGLPSFTSNKRRTSTADISLPMSMGSRGKRRSSSADLASHFTSGNKRRLNNLELPSTFTSRKVSFFVDADGADVV